jgi:branched-chain amino acid transport system substrate-binding protein
MRRLTVTLLLAACVWLACGVAVAPAATLTIYSSLPLLGPPRVQSEDIVRGELLALEEAGSRVGTSQLRLISLNDATRAARSWNPEKTSLNALRAARDETAIAYIGEFNSGATAISLPILNEAGIAQISPSNTYVGLTRREGADRGEPDKYYPTEERTYVRVAPADHLQAAAIVRYLQALRVHRVYLVDDGDVYGQGLTSMVRRRLRARRIVAVGRSRLARAGRNAASIARRVQRSKAQAMFFGGITQNGAISLWREVHRRNSRLQLLGPDGVAESAFTRHLSPGAAARTHITAPTLDPAAYPPAAQTFFAAFRARYGRGPEPYAVYGYEAVSLLLDAMRRAGPAAGDRAAVIRALFATRARDSVLGRYSIDRFGDTTLSTYGGLGVSPRGSLVFDRVLDTAAAAPTG